MGMLVDGEWTTQWYDTEKTKGRFIREKSSFRNMLGNNEYPWQEERYHLFISYACPWAHRCLITRNLKKEKNKPVLSRTDFSVMTDLGKETGALKENEQKIIQNLLRFSRVLVKDIMTPRIVVVASDESMTVEEFHDEHEKLPFSRIPVYKDDSDSITGLVLKDDILLKLVEDEHTKPLKEIKRHIIIVHASLPIPDLLDMFINKKEHMALVVDDLEAWKAS